MLQWDKEYIGVLCIIVNVREVKQNVGFKVIWRKPETEKLFEKTALCKKTYIV